MTDDVQLFRNWWRTRTKHQWPPSIYIYTYIYIYITSFLFMCIYIIWYKNKTPDIIEIMKPLSDLCTIRVPGPGAACLQERCKDPRARSSSQRQQSAVNNTAWCRSLNVVTMNHTIKAFGVSFWTCQTATRLWKPNRLWLSVELCRFVILGRMG